MHCVFESWVFFAVRRSRLSKMYGMPCFSNGLPKYLDNLDRRPAICLPEVCGFCHFYVINQLNFLNDFCLFIGCAGLWGVLAVGIFALDPQLLNTTRGRSGLLHGEGSSRVPKDFFISMACSKVAKSDVPESSHK
jgi:hypothetical protein